MNNQNDSNQIDLKHGFFTLKTIGIFGVLGAFAISMFIIVSIYGSDSKVLQGYLKSVKTTDTAPIEFQYEHLYVLDTNQQTLTMSFYAKDVTPRNLTGFEIVFENFPSYLSYNKYTLPTELNGWTSFGSSLSTEFQKTNPRLSMSGSTLLKDGKLVDVVFDISPTATLSLADVKVKGVFANALNNFETAQGNFFIVPKDKYALSHESNISVVEQVEIPVKIAGVSAANPVYGVTVELENVPSFMTLTSVSTTGMATANWNVQQNLTDSIKRIVMADFTQTGVKVDNSDIFKLVFTVANPSTVTLPTEPITIYAEFADGVKTYYSLPTYLSFGETVADSGDICSKDDDNDLTAGVKDSLTYMADLSCLVVDWNQTGENLAGDVYKADDLSIVNIRDLTVLLSRWSNEPEIQSISPQTGTVGDEININGKYFYPDIPRSKLKVYLQDKEDVNRMTVLTVTDVTADTMKLVVPSTATTGDYNVRISIANELSVTSDGFTVE